MKNKGIKRLMVFGLLCSMVISNVPMAAMASGTEAQTESETRQTEEPRESESEKKEIPSAGGKETPGGAATELPASEPETDPHTKGAAEEVLDAPEQSSREIQDKLTVKGGTEGTDYTYDESTGLIVIKDKAKITLSGAFGEEFAGRIVVEAKEANVTLDKVLLRSSGAALTVKAGCKLNLTLAADGTSCLEAETGNTPAVILEKGADLVIGGEGRLELRGNGTKDIYLSRGDQKEDKDEKKDTPSSLEIRGGTVVAQGGLGVDGDEEQKVQVKIAGGSFDLKKLTTNERKKVSLTGTDGNTAVYKTVIMLDDAESDTGNLAVEAGGKEYKYGNEGIWPDEDKKIYLYLPAKKVSVKVAGTEYDGEVKTDDGTELAKAKAAIGADPVVIPAAEYGYADETALSTQIVIRNTSINGTVVKAELEGSQSKNFDLDLPTDLAVPGNGTNDKIKVKPKADLEAGTYKATVKITYPDGEPLTVEVSFTVNKKKLTATAEIDEKVYDGKRSGTGTVILKGALGGDEPEIDADKATFTFNSANVKDAKTVTIGSLELTEKWSKNYEMASKKFEVEVKDKIKKAPNKNKKENLKVPDVKAVYNSTKKIWQPQLTTYKGQEYLFFGSATTVLSEESKTSKNWKFGDKSSTVENRLITLKAGGLQSGTTYTVWTRFAGDDNHEPSEGEVTAYSTFTVDQGGTSTNPDGNKITGLVEGQTYRTGSRIAFGAVGAGMSNTSPKEGDVRYLPVSWKVSEEHTWSNAPYEAAFTLNQAGSYTLQVTFRKQTYTNGTWTNTSDTSVATVNFKMDTNGADGTGFTTNTPTTPTGGGTGSNGGTGTNGGGSSGTAAKTGDESPILPMLLIFAISACILAAGAYKRKSRAK